MGSGKATTPAIGNSAPPAETAGMHRIASVSSLFTSTLPRSSSFIADGGVSLSSAAVPSGSLSRLNGQRQIGGMDPLNESELYSDDELDYKPGGSVGGGGGGDTASVEAAAARHGLRPRGP